VGGDAVTKRTRPKAPTQRHASAMKYGQHFEDESVPEWNLHNIDYNSLKHQIKTHTTKDQASAIAIPGHQDTALKRFEDAFYNELCRQHDRVDLFVVSKADEIFRRLSRSPFIILAQLVLWFLLT
jgi:SPX domain protein involved in polyphosphate accumulation